MLFMPTRVGWEGACDNRAQPIPIAAEMSCNQKALSDVEHADGGYAITSAMAFPRHHRQLG